MHGEEIYARMSTIQSQRVEKKAKNHWKKLANEGQMGPCCNFRGAFFKKGGPPKGVWTYWYRLFHEGENGSDSADALPPFWGILGNWKCLASNYCRIPDVCLVKQWLKRRREKANETVTGYKCSKQVYRAAVKSVLLSAMFWNSFLILGYIIFCAPLNAAT